MPNNLKLTYENSVNKRKTRDFLLKSFYFQKVVGLAGPDITEYVTEMKERGCKEFEIYENDRRILSLQLASIIGFNGSLKYDDIINSDPYQELTLYDLDFCVTVKSVREYVKKFRDNFIMTFSTRIGIESTISLFFKYRAEKITERVDVDSPIKYTMFKTNSHATYIFIRYKDTSQMCCFSRLKRNLF